MSVIIYDLRKSPIAPGQPETGYRPVVANSNPISEDALYDTIVKRTSLTEGDVKSALSAVAELIADQLGQGNSVNIPELGTFSLSLTADEKIESADDKQAADHIHVAGINFRAKKSLQQRIGFVTFHRTRYPKAGTHCPNSLEAKEIIEDYFEANPDALLVSSTAQQLFHCSRTSVNRRIASLVADGTLVRLGRRSSPYYRLADSKTTTADESRPWQSTT